MSRFRLAGPLVGPCLANCGLGRVVPADLKPSSCGDIRCPPCHAPESVPVPFETCRAGCTNASASTSMCDRCDDGTGMPGRCLSQWGRTTSEGEEGRAAQRVPHARVLLLAFIDPNVSADERVA